MCHSRICVRACGVFLGHSATEYIASKTKRENKLCPSQCCGELHKEIDVFLCVNKEVNLTKGLSRGHLATDVCTPSYSALKLTLVSQGAHHRLGSEPLPVCPRFLSLTTGACISERWFLLHLDVMTCQLLVYK